MEETRRKIYVGGGVAVQIIPRCQLLRKIMYDEPAGRGAPHSIQRRSRITHASGRLHQKN